jgi:hypothetical protein
MLWLTKQQAIAGSGSSSSSGSSTYVQDIKEQQLLPVRCM